MTENKRLRLAIAGVGNCASSLVQGIEFYKDADPDERVPGLMHVVLGDYHINQIDLVAAFDVDATKVGLDLSKAIDAGMNNTIKFADVPDLGVTVLRGPTFDGVAPDLPGAVRSASVLASASRRRCRSASRVAGSQKRQNATFTLNARSSSVGSAMSSHRRASPASVMP